MAKRIGESLLEKGLITRQQLADALKYQLIFGGHLGTCLIELGHVDEVALGETLAEFHRMRHAPAELLKDIPPSVIQALAPELVEKYRIVPLGVSGRTLHVAVIAARELGSVSQLTGYKIVPWIAPEFRVLEAMERYYRIPRRARFLTMSHRLEHSTEAAREPRSQVPPAPSLSPLEEAALHPHVADAGPATDVLEAEDLGAPVEYGRSWREIADRLEATAAPDATPPPAVAQEPVASIPAESAEPADSAAAVADEPGWSFEEAALLMSQADSREELCTVVLAYASRGLAATVLFGVKGEGTYIWDSRGLGLTPARAAGVKIALDGGSIFELLLGDDFYRGPVPLTASCRRFYEMLERPIPREVLLLPVHLNDRLVAVLYGEGGPRGVRGETEVWARLAQKIALALNMIILKAKIRAV